MSAVDDPHQMARLRIRDVTKPLVTYLNILPGHVILLNQEEANEKDVSCSTILYRWYMSESVIREPVHFGRIRGSLFIPKSEFFSFKTINGNTNVS